AGDGSTRDPRSFRRQRRDTGVARKPGPERVDGFFIVTERDDPLPWVRLANVAQPRGAGVVGVRRSLDGAKQIGGTSLMVVEGATELFQIWGSRAGVGADQRRKRQLQRVGRVGPCRELGTRGPRASLDRAQHGERSRTAPLARGYERRAIARPLVKQPNGQQRRGQRFVLRWNGRRKTQQLVEAVVDR